MTTSSTPDIRLILNWLAQARQSKAMTPKELRRFERSLGIMLARHFQPVEDYV